MARAVSEERRPLLENGTDAQDCCRPHNKRLLFGDRVFDTIILEHHPNTSASALDNSRYGSNLKAVIITDVVTPPADV
jgi:hypothetical protein